MKCLPFIFLLLVPLARAEVNLAPLFRDHAVFQRDKPIPVWGTAEPGEEISLTFKGQSRQTRADEAGRWRVELAAVPASKEPSELVVTGKNTVTVHDILVGEVWFCSGQSNMAFSLYKTVNGRVEIRAANLPLIRGFAVPRVVSEAPLDNSKGQWNVMTPDIAKTFSAVAFYFGRDLFQRLDVPIGLITSSWGGTFIESWLSPAGLQNTSLKTVTDRRWKEALAAYPSLKIKYDADIAVWNKAAEAEKKKGKEYTKKPPSVPAGPGHEDTPGGLFNGMVHPFAPYAVRGFLWYQGEANVSRAGEYAELLQALITDWRAAFRQGDLPFYWVQLPKYGSADQKDWAGLREAQSKALSLPATGQVVTVDLPLADPKDKHPPDKLSVCRRLAQVVAAEIYGEKVESSGPRFEKMELVGNSLRLNFSHAKGLVSRLNPVTGFEVAGPDRKFFPATATLQGEDILVNSSSVAKPVAVRFAYNNFPEIGLFNAGGLPAEPFRTDDWPLEDSPRPAATP